MAVICVELLTVKLVAAIPPNVTDVFATLKLVPVMTTVVPPPVGPELGLTLVTVGAPPHATTTESSFSGSTAIPLIRSLEVIVCWNVTGPVVGTVVVASAPKVPTANVGP